MSSQQVPEPWASRMIERGLTDARFHGEDVPSLSKLAEAAGVHKSTVSAAVFGTRVASPDTIARIAGVLGDDSAEWMGVRYGGPWVPPASAALLNDRQRDAITKLINAITGHEEERDEREDKISTKDEGSGGGVTPRKPRRARKISVPRTGSGGAGQGRQR